MGAIVDLTTDRLGTYDFDWPSVAWDENNHPIYPVNVLHDIVTGTEFLISVDLVNEVVAKIGPGGEATVVWDELTPGPAGRD